MYQRDLRRFDPFSQSYQHQIETRPLRVNDVFIDRFCKKKMHLFYFVVNFFSARKKQRKALDCTAAKNASRSRRGVKL